MVHLRVCRTSIVDVSTRCIVKNHSSRPTIVSTASFPESWSGSICLVTTGLPDPDYHLTYP